MATQSHERSKVSVSAVKPGDYCTRTRTRSAAPRREGGGGSPLMTQFDKTVLCTAYIFKKRFCHPIEERGISGDYGISLNIMMNQV